jgi:hypothetical protein
VFRSTAVDDSHAIASPMPSPSCAKLRCSPLAPVGSTTQTWKRSSPRSTPTTRHLESQAFTDTSCMPGLRTRSPLYWRFARNCLLDLSRRPALSRCTPRRALETLVGAGTPERAATDNVQGWGAHLSPDPSPLAKTSAGLRLGGPARPLRGSPRERPATSRKGKVLSLVLERVRRGAPAALRASRVPPDPVRRPESVASPLDRYFVVAQASLERALSPPGPVAVTT